MGRGTKGQGSLTLKLLLESISWVKTRLPVFYQYLKIRMCILVSPTEVYLRGSVFCCRHWPAIAQSRPPDCLSIRKSTYHSPTINTSVSVFSKGGSGIHRIDNLVDAYEQVKGWQIGAIIVRFARFPILSSQMYNATG